MRLSFSVSPPSSGLLQLFQESGPFSSDIAHSIYAPQVAPPLSSVKGRNHPQTHRTTPFRHPGILSYHSSPDLLKASDNIVFVRLALMNHPTTFRYSGQANRNHQEKLHWLNFISHFTIENNHSMLKQYILAITALFFRENIPFNLFIS